VPLGTQQVSISSNAPSARVALIQNDTLLATAVTDGSGNATLNLTDPVTIAEELDLFLHAHNRNPCENTIIVVSNQPYVVNNSFSIDDSGGNGNGEGDFDEFITIAIMLQNVGDQPAQEVIAALNCNDNYFVITDAFEAAGYLGSGDSILLNGAFAGYIADNIPDQHQLLLDLLINDADENSWQYTIPLTVNAPDLQYQTINIDDSDFNNNGRLDPGENVELTVQILNQGHAASPLITVSLTCVEPEIDINPPSLQLTGLDAGEQTAAIFSASIGDMIPPGTPVTFSLETGSGNYTFTHEFILSVGLILDDFESGNMFTMNWENSGNLPWFIESDNPWEGEFCLCSGDITHNQTSVLSITVQVLAGSDLSFMRKVSSENNYDYLRFYIDDVLRDQWSGESSWSQVTYPVDIGEHSFQWVYYKDGSLSSGNDCAWIDYIIFPYIELPGQPDITLAPTSLEFDLLPGNSQQENFVIYNEGNAELEYEMEVQYDSFQSSGRSWSDPDEYGYIWIDSDDPEGPPYNWYELNPAAIPVTFTHNDVSTDLIPLDFSLSFYGESYTSFRISPNGWIGFSNDWSDYHNYAIPRQDAPRAAIFGFWDDLDPLQGGDVYYLQNQDSLIVWFDDVIHYPGIYTGIYDFEIIVYRDGNILCQYNSMTGDLDSATIGIHNLTGDDALQVVYNNNYVHDQLAVFFQKPLTWLEINPHQGTIPEYAQIEINVTSDAGELPPGYYYADILINSNDPDQSCLLLPVTLAINDETLEIPSQIRTHISGNSLIITWNAVDGASSYLVFAADSPYDYFQYVTTVYTNSCLMPLNQSKRFFRITAAN
ncbi:MAG: hypothetical protein JXB60_07625, partial [Candidatus Cloacimonetes bacterium]|nr:hypothetical protein [Candidatus Cloacimonadota bacterium]